MMQICKKCKVKMANVVVFSRDRNERFCRCPKCHGETKHYKISDKELECEEVMCKEVHKRK